MRTIKIKTTIEVEVPDDVHASIVKLADWLYGVYPLTEESPPYIQVFRDGSGAVVNGDDESSFDFKIIR